MEQTNKRGEMEMKWHILCSGCIVLFGRQIHVELHYPNRHYHFLYLSANILELLNKSYNLLEYTLFLC